MAIVSDVEIRLRADIARLQQDMTAARSTVETATASMSRAVDRFKSTLVGLAAGFGFKELASQIIDAQREFDKLNSALITATGSTENANKAFAALQNFAATTPFDLKQTTDAFLKLRNMGLDPSERALRSYGNTAGALGKSLNQMIEAVADATTGEFERLKEFGIKAAQNGDTVRLTFQGVTTSIGNNAKSIQEYLLKLGETKFAGGMELQAKTLDGAISNLGDSWQALLRTISQSGFGDAANKGVRALTDALGVLSDQIKNGGPIIEGLKLAAKLTAAYLAVMAAPAVFAAFNAALGTVLLNLSLIKLELRAGIGLWGLFNTALNGTSVSAALAAGSLTKLQLSASLLFAAFAGWQIGKYLDENFYQARVAGEVFVGEILKGWENIKYGAEVLWLAVKSGWNSVIGGVKEGFATFVEANAAALDKIGASTKAASLKDYAKGLRDSAAAGMDFSRALSLLDAGHDKTIELIQKETDARIAAAVVQGQISEADRQATGDALKGIDVEAQATAQALDWYKKTLDASKDTVDQLVLEAATEMELTAEQKKRVDVLNELERTGKSLSAQQKADIKGWQDLIVLLAQNNKIRKDEQDLRDQRIADARSEVSAAEKQTQSLRDQLKYYGLTEEAVLQLQAAELQRELQNENLDGIARGRLEGLLEQTQEQIDLQKKLTKMKAETTFWSNLEDYAHQAFLSIQNGGADLATRLKASLKTIFFDWLYQMTLKKWIIQVGTSISGTAGVSGIANAATSTGGASSLTSVAGIYNAAKAAYTAISTGFEGIATSVADGVQSILYATGQSSSILSNTALATTTGEAAAFAVAAAIGKYLGGKISGQYELGNHGSTITTIGSLFGIGGGIAGGLINRAFGMGAKQTTSTSIQGTLAPDSATLNAVSTWFQKGGWFRSDKSGTDTKALDATQTAAFASTYKAILDVSKVLGDTIGADTAALSTRVQQLNIDLTGLTDAAAQQEAIAKFFSGVGDTIATELVPGLSSFQAEGETLSATLQRLVTDYAAVDVGLAAIGKSFGAVGISSLAAREALIAAAGGLDKLGSGLSYFQQNILSDSDRLALAQKDVSAALTGLGLSRLKTIDDLKQYALGLDLTDQAQAETFAKLLELAPAFKQVADAADAAAQAAAKASADLAAADAAAKLQSIADAAKLLTGAVDSALDGVTRAVDAGKAAAKKAYDDLTAAIDANISSVGTRISDLQSLSSVLQQRVIVASSAQSAMSRQVAAAAIAAAAQVARQSGILPAADSVKTAIDAIRADTADNYGSLLEYQRAAAQANNDIASLGTVTDDQLSVAQNTLKVLQDQKALAQATYEQEVARLDGILTTAQAQVDAVKGVDTSVQALGTALANLAAALQSAAANPVSGAGGAAQTAYQQYLNRPASEAEINYWKDQATKGVDVTGAIAGSNEAKIQALYQQYLGRAGEAAGVKAWENALAAGQTWQQIEQGFATSNEAQSRNNALAAAVDGLTQQMGQMQNAMTRTANATQQLAQQFDNVSAGGNALATVNP